MTWTNGSRDTVRGQVYKSVQDDLANNVSFFDPVMGCSHVFQ